MVDEMIIRNLNSDDLELVSKSLNDIREIGNVAYIEPMFRALMVANDTAVKREIRKILAEIKTPASIDVFLGMIDDDKYTAVLPDIVSSCWESGLDFSKAIDKFVKLVVESDFAVAFEALSVIENMDFSMAKDEADALLGQVLQALDSAAPERKSLLDAVIFHVRSLVSE